MGLISNICEVLQTLIKIVRHGNIFDLIRILNLTGEIVYVPQEAPKKCETVYFSFLYFIVRELCFQKALLIIEFMR